MTERGRQFLRALTESERRIFGSSLRRLEQWADRRTPGAPIIRKQQGRGGNRGEPSKQFCVPVPGIEKYSVPSRRGKEAELDSLFDAGNGRVYVIIFQPVNQNVGA